MDNEEYFTLKFVKACKDGKIDDVVSSLKNGANINYKNDYGLMNACKYNHLEVVKYLLTGKDLKKHANIHIKKDHALKTVCKIGYFEIAKYLLESPDLKDHACISNMALWNACESGNVELVKHLSIFYFQGNEEHTKSNMEMALVQAAQYGHLEVVRFLLTSPLIKNVDINAKNDFALRAAIHYGQLKMVDYLLTSPELKKHADMFVDNNRILWEAGKYGHIHILKYLARSPNLKQNFDLNWLEEWQCKPEAWKWVQHWLKYGDSLEESKKLKTNPAITKKPKQKKIL